MRSTLGALCVENCRASIQLGVHDFGKRCKSFLCEEKERKGIKRKKKDNAEAQRTRSCAEKKRPAQHAALLQGNTNKTGTGVPCPYKIAVEPETRAETARILFLPGLLLRRLLRETLL